MFIVSAIWLVVLGLLAVPNLLLSRKPNAKELLDKITPYQGWIGAVSAVWGLFGLVRWLLNIKFMTLLPSIGLTFLAACIVELVLGLLLGVGVMKTFVKNEEAQRKLDSVIAKLAPKQGLFGIVAIGLAIWMLLARFVVWKM